MAIKLNRQPQVHVEDPRRRQEEPSLSFQKLKAGLNTQTQGIQPQAQARLAVDALNRLEQAAREALPPGDLRREGITPSMIAAYMGATQEYADAVMDQIAASGDNPPASVLEQATKAAEDVNGAAMLAQFVMMSVQRGDLAKYLVDVKPGAKQMLGGAFGDGE